MDDILSEIEAFRKDHGLAEWRFGLLAANDRRLLPDLKNGRELRRKTAERLKRFMDEYVAEIEAANQAEAA